MMRRMRDWAAVLLVAVTATACGTAGKKVSSTTLPPERSTTTSTSAITAGTTPTTGASTTTTSSATTTTPPSTATTAAPSTVNVTAAQDGQTVVLGIGDDLVVSLDGCGGCGYTWRMTGQPSTVVFSYEGEQTTTPTTAAGSSPMAGQAVAYSWTFKAVSAHTTRFTAGYFPPGSGSAPTQSFDVTLAVSQ